MTLSDGNIVEALSTTCTASEVHYENKLIEASSISETFIMNNGTPMRSNLPNLGLRR